MVEKKQLPNIVIFMPDELRGSAISLDNKHNPIIKTPNIDNLAKDGVAFTKCFTVNPVCAPSKISIFTGQYVHSSGHRSLFQLLEPHEDNLFKFLKRKGYEVFAVGRNDLLTKRSMKESYTKRIPFHMPSGNIKEMLSQVKTNPFKFSNAMFKTHYFGKRSEEQAKDMDYYIIQDSLEYLDSKPDKPFCLFIALSFPHPPYTVEEPYFSMYNRDGIPTPIPPKLEDKPEFMQLMHERCGLDKLSEEDFREILATYYGMITRVDHQLGQIVEKLKEIGQYDNTAVFLFADHGDYAGNYGLTEKWPNAFQDCLVNIPLIVKIPGIEPQNHILDHLIESIDIFPTLMEIAQIKTDYTHFGKNLIPLIKSELKTHRNEVYSEGGYNPREPQCFEPLVKNPRNPLVGTYYDKTNLPAENPETVARSTMIRTKLWKLIIRSDGMEELYDLQYDPNEANNLIDIYAYEKIKIELKEKMLRWYLNTSDNAHYKRQRKI
jgi:choline-sulfatase